MERINIYGALAQRLSSFFFLLLLLHIVLVMAHELWLIIHAYMS